MRVEKFLIVVNNILFYATYDSAEADEKAAFWREKMNSEVVTQIETVSEKQAIAELLDRVKSEKQCVEVLKTQIQEMTNRHNLENQKNAQEISVRDGFLSVQSQALVEVQKKIEELKNALDAPQNRLQRELIQEREKNRKLQKKLSEVRR